MKLVAPRVLTTPRGKSALTRVFNRTVVGIKAHITDSFTTLDNFVVLSGEPTITSGRLSNVGAVRHKDQCATDNYKVTAVVGDATSGRTILATCGSPGFDRFYGLQIENSPFGSSFSIVKGTGVTWTTSFGIFGILIGLISLLVGLFTIWASLFGAAVQTQVVFVGDTVAIWWDEPNSVVRAYRNGVEVTTLDVPRHEIPHGDGYRYFGVLTGLDYPLGFAGVQMTSIDAQDV